MRQHLGSSLQIFVSPAHLDSSVRTGIPAEFYESIKIHRVFGDRAFLQQGGVRAAVGADTTVVDLNPRSVTAWLILLLRRALRRRTLVWGHIHPQAGALSKTAHLRVAMRRLAAGTISYTYRDADKARVDLPKQTVWTAPNSLYVKRDITAAESSPEGRTDVLYVGRFASAKKVDLLVRGFALAAEHVPELKLTLVGGGAEETQLRALIADLAIQDRVDLPGWIDDLALLRPYYERAFCTASPGFAGLGLTQSLGFGVPMVVAEDEPHSPEIELEDCGGVYYFESNSPESLAAAIMERWKGANRLPDRQISSHVQATYSAEAMAGGLLAALEDVAHQNHHSEGDRAVEK